MRLCLVTADAREIAADVQFVKHFDGLIGGSEGALDDALGGRLRDTLDTLESNRFRISQLVRVPWTGVIGSRNLLVLNLGEIGRFSLGDLEGAVVHAFEKALQHRFETVATPVIGISDHVGLPIERAYRVVLQSMVAALSGHIRQVRSFPSITTVTVFDFSFEKVAFFRKITNSILSELGVRFKQIPNDQFDIQLDERVEADRWLLTEDEHVIDLTQERRHEAEFGMRRDKHSLVKVLYLAANPTDTKPLRLDEEIREIDTAFRQAEYRNRFDIRQHWAVRVIDLQSHLLRHKPDIVHFSGHGSSSSSIVLEDLAGKSHSVSPRALGQLFSLLKGNIRCVVLNACYSNVQAQAIAECIDCVVGMSSAIGDKAAISFASAFYQALGYGHDIKTAFELGCVQIDLENLNEQDVPKLLAHRVDPSTVKFV